MVVPLDDIFSTLTSKISPTLTPAIIPVIVMALFSIAFSILVSNKWSVIPVPSLKTCIRISCAVVLQDTESPHVVTKVPEVSATIVCPLAKCIPLLSPAAQPAVTG
jgi:hypothetical protein